jgi:hypothetical protein
VTMLNVFAIIGILALYADDRLHYGRSAPGWYHRGTRLAEVRPLRFALTRFAPDRSVLVRFASDRFAPIKFASLHCAVLDIGANTNHCA